MTSPGLALADEALDAVDDLHHLDAALEEPDQGGVVALVGGVLARRQADVGCRTREALARRRLEVGEDCERDECRLPSDDGDMVARTTGEA